MGDAGAHGELAGVKSQVSPLEAFARDLVRASVEVGSRAIAKAADSALADVHRGVGRVARELDGRMRRARARLEEILDEPNDVEQDDDWRRERWDPRDRQQRW